MNHKKTVTLAALSFGAIGLLSLYMMNEVKRQKLINYKQHIISSLSAEIDAYKKLGFADTDKVIEITKERMSHVQNEIESLKNCTRLIGKSSTSKITQKEQLKNLIKTNKNVVNSYKAEIAEYERLGMANDDKAMQLAHENMARLMNEIEELETKVASMEYDNPAHDILISQKMNKIIALNKESLDLYKKEMEEYVKLGLSEEHPKMRYVKERITIKASEINSLERNLQ